MPDTKFVSVIFCNLHFADLFHLLLCDAFEEVRGLVDLLEEAVGQRRENNCAVVAGAHQMSSQQLNRGKGGFFVSSLDS